MNYLSNLNILKWRKKEYSEFYICTLISFFVFTLGQDVILSLVTWLTSTVQAIFQYSPQNGDKWYMLIIVSFLVTLALHTFFIQPLGFGITVESKSSWEIFWTGFIIFGFFTFVMSSVFRTIDLPAFPVWVQRMLRPNTSILNNPAEREFWSIVPWIWVLAPVAIFYYSLINKGGAKE